jgi:hypothetical protein
MDAIRNGNFTSSEIVALAVCGDRLMTEQELADRPKKGVGSRTTTIQDKNILGESATTYIIECNMERRLRRSLCDEVHSNPTDWGKLLEPLVHAKLSTDYTYFSDVTKVHPEILYWMGTADFKNNRADAIVDSKCPWTLKSFCQLVDPWLEGKRGDDYWNAIRFGWVDNKGLARKKHDQAEKYYWQLVSNSCIYGTKNAELIVFMPLKSELDTVREMANNYGAGHPLFRFWSKPDEEIPHLPEDSEYSNLNVFSFEVPFMDKQFLRGRIELAGKELIEVKTLETV